MLTVADTAFSIAAVRAEERRRPEGERLFDDPFAALFESAGGHAAEATARYLALPFFRDGVRLRTRFIDDAVRSALGDGLGQLVLLGAGFDARGLRMPEIAERGARVFEIDSPGQLGRKQAALEGAGVTLPDRIASVPFDFETPDFEEALAAAVEARGFRRGAGAIFVWEGVIGYIDGPAIDRSLRFMARAGGPGSRLVYTAHEGAFEPDTPLVRMRRWGFSTCEEEGLDAVWRRHVPGEPPPVAYVSRVGVAGL